jgi:hypothetical protein
MSLLSEVETITFKASLKNLPVVERSRNDKSQITIYDLTQDCRLRTKD